MIKIIERLKERRRQDEAEVDYVQDRLHAVMRELQDVLDKAERELKSEGGNTGA